MDRTILVNDLKRGKVQRALQVNVQAGGKGLNVARAVRRLGEAVRVTGFAGGLVGSFLRSECRRVGIDDRLTVELGSPDIAILLEEA
jgi:tagatose 6-phosphate kinase